MNPSEDLGAGAAITGPTKILIAEGITLTKQSEVPSSVVPTSSTNSYESNWTNLVEVSQRWFHNPDVEALRVCLATVKALDVETRPVWLMILGPSSCGKTDYFIQACTAYTPHEVSDDISLAGLLSGSAQKKGQGVLTRLKPKGLWLMSDFTVVLNSPEERRNSVLGAQRKIFDGKYDRDVDGEKVSWEGHINAVFACTPAIERFARVNSDMGERFMQIRLSKPEMSDDLVRKVSKQRKSHKQFHTELMSAAKKVLRPGIKSNPDIPFEIERLVARWGEFVSILRIKTERNFKDEINGIGHEEGSTRISQELMGMCCGDAALFGQAVVTGKQLEIVKRVAFDTMPWARRAVMLQLTRCGGRMKKTDLHETCGIPHPYTFQCAIDELQAIGVVKIESELCSTVSFISLTDKVTKLLSETTLVESKDVHQTPHSL